METLSISNSKGEPVRSIMLTQCSAGQNTFSWDGRDEHRAKVASGVYFYEVRFKGEVQGKEMVVVR